MKLESRVFKTSPVTRDASGPRFKNQAEIQDTLEGICEDWVEHLKRYVNQTEALFGKPELPWTNTERAIVSTLSASISQSFPESLVLEEGRVKKGQNNGRCDLWVSIPALKGEKSPFSFYLEAKRAQSKKSEGTLPHFLKSKYGISRIFRDYAKGKAERLTHRSPYCRLRSRIHPHYVIGLLLLQLASTVRDLNWVETTFEGIFKETLSFELKSLVGEAPKSKKRRLDRFATVALAVIPEIKNKPGMLAIFTILGSSADLSA